MTNSLPICLRRWFILILFLSVSSDVAGAVAATVGYGSQIWRTEEGLPQNVVHALAQDHNGYLWVGTQNGLCRFDGVRFVVFNSGNTPQLGGSHIYALAAASDGLWVGTMNNGVVRLRDGRFELFTQTNGLINNSVRCILSAKDGSIWIGTTNGVSQFKSGTFRNFQMSGATNVVRALCEDRDGSILAGTGGGVIRIRNGETSVAYLGLPGPAVRSLVLDGQGRLWIGYAGGIARVVGQTLDESVSVGLPDNMINAVMEDSRGQMWAGSFGGITRLVGTTNWIVQRTPEGAAFDAVNALLEDREGNIWAGTKDGLVRLHRQLFTRVTIQEGLAHNNTISVLEDGAGNVWSGTWGGGLHRIYGKDVEIINSGKGLSRDQVLALHHDRAGALWVGTDFDGGLNCLRNGTNTVFDRASGLVDSAIRVLHEDRAGRLWIGTATALVLFENGKFRRFTREDGLCGNNIRVLLEDDNGVLWVGTNEGLSWLVNAQVVEPAPLVAAIKRPIVALHQDTSGDVWIGTVAGGLHRMKIAGGTGEAAQMFSASSYTSSMGLGTDDVHEIIEDDFGFIWITSRNGVFRVPKTDFDEVDSGRRNLLRSQGFARRDGLPSLECSAVAKPGAWKARDGRLWFATAKGLAVVDARLDLEPTAHRPHVLVEHIVADSQTIALDRARRSLTIPPGRGDLQFHFTALSLSQPGKNRFEYQLVGFDADWIDAGNQRIAYYTQVPPGRYTFRVRGCNSDGIWNEEGASITITMMPHLWQTWWFRSGIVFFAAGMVGWGVRTASVRKLEKQMRILEQERALAAERSRIAKDMHDDVGARLTQIMLLSDVVEKCPDAGPQSKSHITRISSASRDLVQNLDAIVWAVDPGNDTLDQLVLYLHDYVDRYLSASAIRTSFDIPSNLPNCSVPSQIRHNLFMVVKEALNNIVKHAQCSELSFAIRFRERQLSVVISDNGKGFDYMQASTMGNGLQNMSDRMQQVGGTLEIKSAPGQGTCLSFHISL
jgi:ligand-binding sensor domain-containing protein/signal transduction histidine kinase